MEKQRHIIIAPHADDELIGCYSILAAREVELIYFPSDKVANESEWMLNFFNIPEVNILLNPSILNDKAKDTLSKGGKIFFPDPIYEWHPDHRRWGHIGEELIRAGFTNVVFYSVNMTAPYIRKVKNPEAKRNALNECYPDKRSLWEYDHKYFLFEGHCQWLIDKNLCQD